MSRERELVQSLVDLADILVDDFDVIDLLTGLADRCVHLLGISAAGVMLADRAGGLWLAAASSERLRVVELFELQAREGPCLEAFRTGRRVAHEDLTAGAGRWPRFATVAAEAGFRSAFALPLRARDTTIGALTLFSAGRIPMDEDDVLIARAFADLAALTILQQNAAAETRRVNSQLTHALTSRVVIEQAKGVIFERAGIDMDAAFARLRDYSRCHRIRLTEVARATLDGSLDPAGWTAPQ